MCGRYMLMDDPALLERPFGFAELSELPRQLVPRFNIAPTQPVPIVPPRPAAGSTSSGRSAAFASG
jgi:putative SOS response-associated peptidase YedK